MVSGWVCCRGRGLKDQDLLGSKSRLHVWAFLMALLSSAGGPEKCFMYLLVMCKHMRSIDSSTLCIFTL